MPSQDKRLGTSWAPRLTVRTQCTRQHRRMDRHTYMGLGIVPQRRHASKAQVLNCEHKRDCRRSVHEPSGTPASAPRRAHTVRCAATVPQPRTWTQATYRRDRRRDAPHGNVSRVVRPRGESVTAQAANRPAGRGRSMRPIRRGSARIAPRRRLPARALICCADKIAAATLAGTAGRRRHMGGPAEAVRLSARAGAGPCRAETTAARRGIGASQYRIVSSQPRAAFGSERRPNNIQRHGDGSTAPPLPSPRRHVPAARYSYRRSVRTVRTRHTHTPAARIVESAGGRWRPRPAGRFTGAAVLDRPLAAPVASDSPIPLHCSCTLIRRFVRPALFCSFPHAKAANSFMF